MAVLALITAAPRGVAAQAHASELDQLTAFWAKLSDMQVVIVAHEFDGKTRQDRLMRYAYLRPSHAKIELLDGPFKGMVAVWKGGETVVAYRRGFLSGIRKTFGLHDKLVTSLRGNGVTTPEFGPALQCFQAHAAQLQQLPGPTLDGQETVMLVIEDKNGLHCPTDSPLDAGTVTKDVIMVNRATHLPMRRIRYAGDTQVEEWILNDLRINSGLSPQDFS